MSDDTIILIGNGPSLNNVTDEFLGAYPIFGCNWIHLPPLGIIPTYYSIFGWTLLDTLEKQEAHDYCIRKAKMAFINREYIDSYPYSNVFPLFPCNHLLYDPMKIGWSDNIHKGVYSCQTVLYVNLQIIYYLGFRRVLIVGLDGDYGNPDGSAEHFYPRSELTGGWESHRSPELRRRIAGLAFTEARRRFEADGREIINLTPHSKCTAFISVYD